MFTNHKDLKRKRHFTHRILFLFWLLVAFLYPGNSFGKIYIDINAPSMRKFKIAIPDFKNMTAQNAHADMASKLNRTITNDLDLSGYFSPMDKEAFLEGDEGEDNLSNIRFKNWSVIGAELLLKGNYVQVGRRLEVEVRLFDVFWGRQIIGKRALGEVEQHRHIMHRLGDEIIKALTGQPGIFTTKLAFVGNATGHKEIYLCDYDGHNVRQLTEDDSIALSPRFSPDGKKILYSSYRDGWPVLYMEDLNSKKVARVSGREGLNIGASWTPDGREIALTLSRKGNSDIFILDHKGKIKGQLTDNFGIDVSPTFSPDGKKMAFVSNRSGSPQIYIRDLVQGTEERLTFEGNYNASPSWSKQNRIAFASMDQGTFNIFVINPDGSRLRRITDGMGDNEDPCWSPDGRYLVYSSSREGPYHLYMMNANGFSPRKITFLNGDQTAPSWAP